MPKGRDRSCPEARRSSPTGGTPRQKQNNKKVFGGFAAADVPAEAAARNWTGRVAMDCDWLQEVRTLRRPAQIPTPDADRVAQVDGGRPFRWAQGRRGSSVPLGERGAWASPLVVAAGVVQRPRRPPRRVIDGHGRGPSGAGRHLVSTGRSLGRVRAAGAAAPTRFRSAAVAGMTGLRSLGDPPGGWGVPVTSTRTPLVARAREVSCLRALARAVGSGSGRAVVLSGPAGVGKTAVVRAALSDQPMVWVDAARWSHGDRVVDGTRPVTRVSNLSSSAAPGRGAGTARTAVPPSTAGVEPVARDASITTALRTAVASGAAVAVVDGAEALGAEDLTLLWKAVETLAASSLLLVVTIDPSGFDSCGWLAAPLRPATRAASPLLLPAGWLQLGLGSLADRQVADLLELHIGPVAPTTRRELVRRLGAIPEALVCAAAALDEAERCGYAPLPDVLSLGPRLQARMDDRLGGLAAPVRWTLGAVGILAALPAPVATTVLRSEPAWAAALDAATDTGVVALDGGRLRVVDRVLGAAAVRWLRPEERVELHRRAGEALRGSPQRWHAWWHLHQGGCVAEAASGVEAAARWAREHHGVSRAAWTMEQAAADIGGTEGLDLLERAADIWLAADLGDRARQAWTTATWTARGVGVPEAIVTECLERAPLLRLGGLEAGADATAQAADRLADDGDPTVQVAAGKLLLLSALKAVRRGVTVVAVDRLERARELLRTDDAGSQAADWVLGLARTALGRAATDVVATLTGQRAATPVSGALSGANELSSLVGLLALAEVLHEPYDWLPAVTVLAIDGGQPEQLSSWLAADTARLLAIHPAYAQLVDVARAHLATAVGHAHQALGLARSAGAQADQQGDRRARRLADEAVVCAAAAMGDEATAVTTGAALLGLDGAFDVDSFTVAAALAELALATDRPGRALGWLAVAEPPLPATGWRATVLLEVLRRCGDVQGLRARAAALGLGGSEPLRHAGPAWRLAAAGVVAEDAVQGASLLRRAAAEARRLPRLRGVLHLLLARALEERGDDTLAGAEVRAASAEFATVGAGHWAMAAERRLAALRVRSIRPGLEDPPALRSVPTTHASAAPGSVAETDNQYRRRVATGSRRRAAVSDDGVDRVPAEPPAPWQVLLLGGFEVHRNGASIGSCAPQVATIVKMVALESPVHAEQVIEALWPGLSPVAGGQRLRRSLYRLRQGYGPLVVRRGSLLALAADAVVDVTTFEDSADRAVRLEAERPGSGVAEARAALALYRGELLPEDRYEPWTESTRAALARKRSVLLELLLDAADRAGNGIEAAHVAESLVRAEPLEERWYLEAARRYWAAGRRERARELLAAAERTMAELGLRPSADLLALQAQVGAARREAG